MGYPIGKQIKLEGRWDFDVDGGAQGAFELISVPINFRVEDIFYEIETAFTSDGTPTCELGDGDDPNGYFADFQSTMDTPAIYGAGAQYGKGALAWEDTEDSGLFKVYAAADTIDFTVGTADLTAGKMLVTVLGTRLK